MESKGKKYIVLAGYVTSIFDGQRHFMSCPKLAELYGVHKDECIFINDEKDRSKCFGLNIGEYERLSPREDGDYRRNSGNKD